MVPALGRQDEGKWPRSMNKGIANSASRKMGLSGGITIVSIHMQISLVYVR